MPRTLYIYIFINMFLMIKGTFLVFFDFVILVARDDVITMHTILAV